MAADGHLGFVSTEDSAIRSADPENPTVESNIKWSEWLVAKISPFEFFQSVSHQYTDVIPLRYVPWSKNVVLRIHV